MTKNEKEFLDKTYDMFRKHWIETNNVEESWERTKRLLHWYRIGLKDGATEQHKLVLQESIDEEELEKLAHIKANEKYPDKRTSDTLGSFEYERNIFIEGFKAGNIEPNLLFTKKINEEELNELAENIVDTFLNSDYTEGCTSYGLLKNLVKAGYCAALKQ